MSSVAERSPRIVAYGASKGAVCSYQIIAIDCARKGYKTRCNSSPPLYRNRTGRGSMNLGGGDPAENYKNDCIDATGRTRRSSDVANAVLFLASAEANHITGAELVVDGGLTAV